MPGPALGVGSRLEARPLAELGVGGCGSVAAGGVAGKGVGGCEAAGLGGTGCDVAPVGVIDREGVDAAGGEDLGAGIAGCEAAGADACSHGTGSGLAYVGVAGRKDAGVGAARWAVGGVDGCSHGFGSGIACGGFLGCAVVGAGATGSGLVSGFWLCGVERLRGGGGRFLGLVAGSRDPGGLPMPQGGLPMRRRGRRAGAVIDRSRASAMARSAIGSGVRTSATVWGGWPWEWGRAAFWG